jgi:xylose isomerase
MNSYFKKIDQVKYLPNSSPDRLSYKFYDPEKMILNKTMAEHLRVAVCYWHNFCWEGNDAFGEGTRLVPWKSSEAMRTAHNKADAIFDFISKLGLPYFTFHDTDVAPEGNSLSQFIENLNIITDYLEQKMSETGIKLLWGTANLFSNKRYLAGASTNPNPEIFAYAAAQSKYALEKTHKLKGDNYVVWGGREGYDTLLNTDLKKEKEHFAKFLSLLVNHKHKIGFKGQLLIEPKPCEPTKHQYDYDTETVYGFLQQYNLEGEFKVNIEANHATLAGHSFEHEVANACALDFLGSIDANRGDPQNGWDTDQFPNSIEEMSLIMYRLLKSGGFTTGGFNFDSKVRRQSINLEDMFYGHVGGVDVLAKSLVIAEKMIKNNSIENLLNCRYEGWKNELGLRIMDGTYDLEKLAHHAESSNLSPKVVSGKQEQLENIVNNLIYN